MAILKRTDIYEGGKALEEVKKEITELIGLQKELQKATREVNATGSGAEAKERLKLTKQLSDANLKLSNSLDKEQQELVKVKVALQEKTRLQKLKIQIDKAESGSIEKLRLTTRKLILERDKLNTTTISGVKEFRKLTKEINQNNIKLKQLNQQIGRNHDNVGNYRDALKGLGRQLLGAAGIVGGITLFTNAVQNLAEKVNILNKGTRKIISTFKVTNTEARALSSKISALANNFDENYNEILNAANAVSKEFGITAQASLDLIEEGFKKGSNNSGEFLDIIKEYPAQLQSVGLNAEESFAIINQQVKAGVYSDKGIDAIKEAGIALRENTKAVQDALAPLDENIKLEIKREVAAGNTFKAMQLIASQLDDTNLTAAQTQAIMSDVFKGAGEDALTFVQNLDEVKLSLDDTESQLSDVEEANLELSKTWNDLVGEVSTGTSFISRAWSGLLRIASGIVEQLNYWLSNQNKINAFTKKSIGFQEKLDKLLSDQSSKIKSITDKDKQRSYLIKRYQKLQIELAFSERDAAIARESGGKTDVEREILRIELLNGLIDGLKEYIPELRAQNKEVENNITISDYQNEKSKIRAKIIKEQNNAIKTQLKLLGLQDKLISKAETADISEMEDLDAMLESELDATEKADKKKTETKAQNIDYLADLEKKRQEEIDAARLNLEQTFQNEAINYAKIATDAIVDNQLNRQLAGLQAREDALKNNLEKGLITEQQYAEQLAEIQKKRRIVEARAEKRKALYEIAINTAVAIIKALPNFIAAGLVAAAGAVQAAFVAATPLPKFQKGGKIGGKRHSEGGTVIEAEKDEFILSRQAYANAPMLAEAINSGMIRDKDLGLRKGQKDNLILGMMIQGLRKDNKQVIELLSNMGYAIPKKDYIEERRSNGEIFKHIIK